MPNPPLDEKHPIQRTAEHGQISDNFHSQDPNLFHTATGNMASISNGDEEKQINHGFSQSQPEFKPQYQAPFSQDSDTEQEGTQVVIGSPDSERDEANLIDWQVEDAGHPRNWKTSRKWTAVAIVSAYTFMSPVSSSILAPSLEDIGHELNIKSASVQSLCLSIFVLGFASGPLIFAPLSEMYGRRIVLHASHVLYLIFNCACGFAQTTAQMLAFRFLGGVGGSAALALGPGVLADLFSADRRGVSSGLYALFPMLGPALGPLCGGFITEYTTWRWGFWGTSIVDVPILTFGLVFLEETYPTVLIRWRKDKLVKQTGNTALFTPAERIQLPLTKQLGQALLRPMKLLTTQVIIIVMGAYQAYLYGLMYLVLTTFPRLWTQDYGQSPSHAGLNYISLGLGYCIGLQAASYVQDQVYRILKKRNNGIGLPEFRLPLLIPAAILLPLGLFVYGWSAQHHTHWIVPNIGAFFIAASIMIGFNALMIYVVDSYATFAASAAAATSVLRAACAFVFPLWAPYLYEALGNGWGNSVLAFVAIGIGGPAPVLLWYYGARLRARSRFCAE